jgi:hypothetical protein
MKDAYMVCGWHILKDAPWGSPEEHKSHTSQCPSSILSLDIGTYFSNTKEKSEWFEKKH